MKTERLPDKAYVHILFRSIFYSISPLYKQNKINFRQKLVDLRHKFLPFIFIVNITVLKIERVFSKQNKAEELKMK